MKLEVASDVICPWCYIGKRRLEKALAMLKSELTLQVSWLPFQLNPGMPKEGMPRAEYRRAKFGSPERSRQLDARVIAEGRSEGIDFAFDRIERTPNTSEAHRLIALAGNQTAVVDALFRAYFEDARDIGDPAVLADIATQCRVPGWPERAPDVSALEDEVRGMGISAVPTFIFDRKSGISGAYPPETLAQAIRQAAAEPVR
ncbi:MAG TPA: DsbA family oxidoreductase [Burkholderiales bacterium]|nr:DsbA family oxidoreductase [Burkholderiales bacterium]